MTWDEVFKIVGAAIVSAGGIIWYIKRVKRFDA